MAGAQQLHPGVFQPILVCSSRIKSRATSSEFDLHHLKQLHQEERQLRHVSDKQQGQEENPQKGQGRSVQAHYWFVKTETCDEQVESHRRGRVTDLHVDREDEAIS
jgi:hypothetical protein